jgi:hypothetical protein
MNVGSLIEVLKAEAEASGNGGARRELELAAQAFSETFLSQSE